MRDIARMANPGIEVKRAHFSNIERAHIIRAAQNPVELDERQAQAVAARIELDLRIGAAFTRWQTKLLQNIAGLESKVISYGGVSQLRTIRGVDSWLTIGSRLMPISYAGIRGGSISSRKELCA